MECRLLIKQLLIFVILSNLTACTQNNKNQISANTTTAPNGGFALPAGISSLPNPSDLTATLSCPNGDKVLMTLDANYTKVSGSCKNLQPGTNEQFDLDFTYGPNNIILAHASKKIDIIAGSNQSITFLTADYDESFDDDNDGYTNIYEITHGMDPTKPEPPLDGLISVTSNSLVMASPDTNLSATLECPNGATVTMGVDTTNNTATSGCSGLTPGTTQTFTINIIYGATKIKLASASKIADIVAGTNPDLTFSLLDFNTTYDDDNDGYTNVYEIDHGMDPNTANYQISGSIQGLTGTIVLGNGSDQITINAKNTFNFNSPPVDGSLYDVTVVNQPSGQTCSVSYGKGAVNGAAVSNIYVGCANNNMVYFVANNGQTGNEPYISNGTATGTTILKNINAYTSSNPSNFAVMNGTTYFTADDGKNGNELWRSDATGTSMVLDINQGNNSQGLPNSSNPYSLTVVGNTLYFTADDGSHGRELWKTDGTPNGTKLVQDIYQGIYSGYPSSLTAIGTTLYFSANDSVNGTELWKSYFDSVNNIDVTAMVKDIYSGTTTSGATTYPNSSSPYSFAVVGNLLYFTARDGTAGRQIWVSNGLDTGTSKLTTIFQDVGDEVTDNLTTVGNTLYFTGTDGTTGVELWKYDGTAVSLVDDIFPGSNSNNVPFSSFPSHLTAISNTLFFVANDGTHGTELWTTDSTGTHIVKDINQNSNSSDPSQLTAVGSTLYFSANDGKNGFELWKTDGSSNNTKLVSDINPNSGSSFPAFMTNVNGTVYFAATDGSTGQELWKTYYDASTGSDITTPVMDINPGPGNSYPTGLTDNSGILYFSAFDTAHGVELWSSDSTNTTNSGTQLVADISNVEGSSNPSHFTTTTNGIHFFTADNGSGTGNELWRTDGTSQGTYQVKLINQHGPSNVYGLTAVGDTIYFSADNGINGWELWKSDGTEAGTVMVKDIFQGSNNSYPNAFGTMGNTAYFEAQDGLDGFELWKSDGTNAGTMLVKDISPGPGNSTPFYMTPVGNTLFFVAFDPGLGYELWKSDGTNSGTKLVSDINPNTNSSWPSNLTALGSYLYFAADDGSTGYELWKTDGLITTQVADINPTAGSNPYNIVLIGNTLYFGANDGTNGVELWKNISNGTTDTTSLVADINKTGDSNPGGLRAVGNTLYFGANDGTNGDELWKVDNATGLPVMVADINQTPITGGTGTNGSNPNYLTAIGNALYFIANDGVHGYELWKSDSSGTSLVQDINANGDGVTSILGQ